MSSCRAAAARVTCCTAGAVCRCVLLSTRRLQLFTVGCVVTHVAATVFKQQQQQQARPVYKLVLPLSIQNPETHATVTTIQDGAAVAGCVKPRVLVASTIVPKSQHDCTTPAATAAMRCTPQLLCKASHHTRNGAPVCCDPPLPCCGSMCCRAVASRPAPVCDQTSILKHV